MLKEHQRPMARALETLAKPFKEGAECGGQGVPGDTAGGMELTSGSSRRSDTGTFGHMKANMMPSSATEVAAFPGGRLRHFQKARLP
jgi:hypothetical protein